MLIFIPQSPRQLARSAIVDVRRRPARVAYQFLRGTIVNIDAISAWLTTTVPGIIFLGAAGSIIAIPIVKIMRWGSFHILDTVLVSHVRPYLIFQLLSRKYVATNDLTRAVALITIVTGSFCVTTLLLGVFAALSVVYFIANGLDNARVSVTIAVILGLTFSLWLHDFFSLGGVVMELLAKDYNAFRNLLAKSDDTKTAFLHFNSHLMKSPSATQLPASSESAPALLMGKSLADEQNDV